MNQTIKDFIKKHHLINKDDHLLVAVSGGPDSMALLHFLYEYSTHFTKLSAVHVEHGLRGESSLKDMELVQSYCEEREISFYCHKANVLLVKEKEKLSTQEAARKSRYRYFEKLMKEIGATKLAMAHHGDDQIETMLMRQVRGALSGLRGIPIKRSFSHGEIIRPFLPVEKQQIIQYCKEESVPFRIDESNETEDYQRNRFRKHILPVLKKENGKVHETFQRQSEWFQEEDRLLQTLAKKEVEKVIIRKERSKITLSIHDFFQISLALQRRGLHLILNYLSNKGSTYITSHHLDLILSLMTNETSSSVIHLPKGIVVEKVYNQCEFYCLSEKDKVKSLHEIEIEIPGMVETELGKVTVDVIKASEQNVRSEHKQFFYADLDKIARPLRMRSRRNGDKISLLGTDGTKKLKDIFIDEKIPKSKRDVWPLLVDGKGELLWVPLLKRSNKALVESGTNHVLVMEFKKREK